MHFIFRICLPLSKLSRVLKIALYVAGNYIHLAKINSRHVTVMSTRKPAVRYIVVSKMILEAIDKQIKITQVSKFFNLTS